jgi:hypothetical protein
MTTKRIAGYFLFGALLVLSAVFVSIPALAQESSLQPDSPELKDQTGDIIGGATTGELVIITTTINSNSTEDENFVAMVEARNSIGITELLEFQTGQASSGSVEVGISWTPAETGEYELRTFLISDLLEPQVLSEVTTTKVTVGE